MDPVILFVALAVIYGAALFFDLFFKSCMHYPYEAFMRNTGLTVKFLRIKWFTTAFNRTIVKWSSSSCNRFFYQSYNFGVIVTFILLPLGVLLFAFTLFHSEEKKTLDAHTTRFLDTKIEVLLPGLNLPLDEISFYIISLAICTIVHEFGHAIAAVVEDVPLVGIGINVVFCFPVAYTVIGLDHMNSLKTFKKLRIICAGIWHNVLLGVLCFLLFSGLGYILSPFYMINNSVVITEVKKNSPMIGAKGLFVNDIITDVNSCKVYDLDSWYGCLLKTIRAKPAYCVSSDFIRLNDESAPVVDGHDGILQCCDPTNHKVICFEYIDDISNDDPLEIPQHMCLDIRSTIEKSSNLCTTTCDDGFCIKPILNNSTTIITVKRRNKEMVMYIGHPADISQTVKVSPFIPKTSYFNPQIADSISLFLKYNTVISLGLAVVNALPCFGLDGHHISSTIINSFLVKVIKVTERNKREFVTLFVSCVGTFLFISTIIKTLWISVFRNLL